MATTAGSSTRARGRPLLPKLLISHRSSIIDRRLIKGDVDSQQPLFSSFPRSSDETDRLPRKLRVHLYTVVFTVLSGLSYIFDFGTDIFVGFTQFAHCHYVEAALVLIFAYVPSIFVNLLGYLWAMDDLKQRPRHRVTNRLKKSVWIFGVMTQTIPALFHFESAYYCVTFRRLLAANNGVVDARMLELFYWILESDRDSTLLNVFLAFMESAPQLFLQAYILCMHVLHIHHHTTTSFYAWMHYFSMAFSLFGLSWSLMSQHRCLRYVRQDKENLSLGACILILVWRTLTLIGRFTALLVFALTFQYWLALLLFAHYLAIVFALTVVEKPKLADSKLQQSLLVFVVAWVHLFCPWNVEEGISRYRYIFRYGLELLEWMIIFASIALDRVLSRVPAGINFQYATEFVTVSVCCYAVGLIVMCCYYSCCHPNLLVVRRRPTPPLLVVYSPPEKVSTFAAVGRPPAPAYGVGMPPIIVTPDVEPGIFAGSCEGNGLGGGSYCPDTTTEICNNDYGHREDDTGCGNSGEIGVSDPVCTGGVDYGVENVGGSCGGGFHGGGTCDGGGGDCGGGID